MGLCTKEDKIYDLLEQGFPKIRELAALFVDDKIKGMRILPTPKVNNRNRHVRGFAGSGHSGWKIWI